VNVLDLNGMSWKREIFMEALEEIPAGGEDEFGAQSRN
jgi:hypothetical protein